jgi:rhodanese-related sulfurtransferase
MHPVIIDVREPEEYQRGHVDGALNIPPSEIIDGAHQLDAFAKDTPFILYCLSGARSNSAIHLLKSYGFTHLTNGINQDHVRSII